MRILLLLLVFVSSQKSFAQNLISGIVVNSETAEPLPYANVSLSSNKGTLTNINGTFQLQKKKKIPPWSFPMWDFILKIFLFLKMGFSMKLI